MMSKYVTILLDKARFTLKAILLGMSFLYLATYLVIVCFRIRYPFELEWIEGGCVDNVRRILEGKSLYVEPSIEFIPYIYTPLYFYVSALVAKFMGANFLTLRLVSFLASLGCFFLIFLFVRRETRSAAFGILAAGLFSSTFRISGAWFDIARIDSLFLVFLLGSIYLLRFHESIPSLIGAGLLIFLSFLTKQTALIVYVPLCVYSLFRFKGLKKFIFPLVVFSCVSITTVIFHIMTDGWSTYYIFTFPGNHHVAKRMIFYFWRNDLAAQTFIALGISVFYLLYQLYSKRYDSFIFFGLLFIGMIGASWLSRLNIAGYYNVLFPAYAIVSIGFGIGLHLLLTIVVKDLSANHFHRRCTELLLLLLCIFQFVFLYYSPKAQVPTKADEEAGNAFIRIISRIDGEVFVPSHGFLPSLAGKKTFAHYVAIDDIYLNDTSIVRENLIKDIEEAISSKRFQAIILDRPWFIKEIDFNRFYDAAPENLYQERLNSSGKSSRNRSRSSPVLTPASPGV